MKKILTSYFFRVDERFDFYDRVQFLFMTLHGDHFYLLEYLVDEGFVRQYEAEILYGWVTKNMSTRGLLRVVYTYEEELKRESR